MLIYNCKLSLLGKRQPLYTTNDDNAYTMYFILPKIMVSIPVCLLTSQSSCYIFPFVLTCVLYFQKFPPYIPCNKYCSKQYCNLCGFLNRWGYNAEQRFKKIIVLTRCRIVNVPSSLTHIYSLNNYEHRPESIRLILIIHYCLRLWHVTPLSTIFQI